MDTPEQEKNHFRSHWVPALTVFAVTFLVFALSLHYDFLSSWDDPTYITGNEDIRSFAWDKIRTVFSSFYVGNYAPVHILSYSLDYLLWGGTDPFGFRVTNYSLHALNALLLFFLLLRLGIGRGAAFLISLIFGVHPLQVESVVWLTERKNVLCMTFFLLSFLFYIRFRGTGRHRDYLLSLVMFCLSLLTKAVTVVGPMIFVLYDLCFTRERKLTSVALRQVPFAAGSLVLAAVTYVSQGSSIVEYWGGSPLGTVSTMMGVFVRYIYLCFFPFPLSAVYDPPIYSSPLHWQVFVSFVLLSALAGWMVWDYFRGERVYVFFIAWFFIFLIPVSQIIPINILMQDRYLYFPIIGWAAVPVFAVRNMMEKGGGAMVRKGFPLFLGIMVLCYSLTTLEREQVWQDTKALFGDAVKKVPEQGRAFWALAGYFIQKEDYPSAVENYQAAILKTRKAYKAYRETGEGFAPRTNYDLGLIKDSFLALGGCFLEMEDYDQALLNYDNAIRTKNDMLPEGHEGLGRTYFAMGRYEEAIKEYRIALDQYGKTLNYGKKLNSYKYPALKGLAICYGLVGRYEDALKEYRSALEIEPEDLDLYYNLGITYLNIKRYPEAEAAFLKSKDADIAFTRTFSHLNLGVIYYEHLNDPEKALYYLKKTLELDPEIPQKQEIIESIKELEHGAAKHGGSIP